MFPLLFIESSSTFLGHRPAKIAINIKNISFSSCNLQLTEYLYSLIFIFRKKTISQALQLLI